MTDELPLNFTGTFTLIAELEGGKPMQFRFSDSKDALIDVLRALLAHLPEDLEVSSYSRTVERRLSRVLEP